MHAIAEKEHPKGPLGTVKGHKTTKKQQALFGIARGMQNDETPKGYSPAAAKLAGGLSGKEVHKIASKPKSGFRRSPKKGESAALNRVMQMVAEVEAQGPGLDAGPDVRNTGFPAHVASDEDKFAEIFKRLAALEQTIKGPGLGMGK
jgi:hypothetical protein